MKKVAIFLLFVFGVSQISAQQYANIGGEDIQENNRTFSQRLEEGIRSNVPSRMTFYGELYPRGWFGGQSSTRVVQGADLKQDDSYFGLLWEFTNYTGMVFETTSVPEWDQPYLYIGKAYVYTDIAGEAGSENMIAKVSVGRLGFDSEFFSLVDPMGTGDDIQHDGNMDYLNWRLELGTKGENVFPIIFMLANDLDFGYQGSGMSSNSFYNKGATGLLEIRSVGYNIADVVNLSWNGYYSGRYISAMPGSTERDTLNQTTHSVGGTLGMAIALTPGHSVDVGAGFEYDYWSYGGSPTASAIGRVGRTFQALDWQAGVAYTMENMFAVALGMRQDAVSHAEYAALHGVDPLTEFILGASVHYLGLKQVAKLSFYLGLGYSFGSLFGSNLYKDAWSKGGVAVYGDGYFDKDGGEYIAGSPFSADVGMGYHPTSNTSLFVGYQYGRYGVEAPNGSDRDFNGNWGKVYVKGAYLW